jgi:hypothetical protein
VRNPSARKRKPVTDPFGEMLSAIIAASTDRLIEKFTGKRNAKTETAD